jgi:class 3 adenylate cyclase
MVCDSVNYAPNAAHAVRRIIAEMLDSSGRSSDSDRHLDSNKPSLKEKQPIVELLCEEAKEFQVSGPNQICEPSQPLPFVRRIKAEPSPFERRIKAERRTNAENTIMKNFPENVAYAMMEGRAAPQFVKDPVSIYFCNIVDYSTMCSCMEPLKLINMLERLFAKLDRLAILHGVQMIDTMDGCYIAATNFVSDQSADHAPRLASFALAALAAAGETAIDAGQPNLGSVSVRAGLHCGAVCGSVLGTHGGRKHTILGDAVNVASRMQSQGSPGAVQCSSAFAALLAAQDGVGGAVELVQREGKVAVKGIGPMQTFWIVPPRPEAASSPAAHAAVPSPVTLAC